MLVGVRVLTLRTVLLRWSRIVNNQITCNQLVVIIQVYFYLSKALANSRFVIGSSVFVFAQPLNLNYVST